MAIELTKELLTKEPENIAKSFGSDTTKNQIRKFYNDFLVLKNKADLSNDEDFKKNILPLVYFSKAKLAYSYGRKTISKGFVDVISSYINRIETKADFDNFLNFYQALIGYVQYYSLEKDEEKKYSNDFNKQREGFRR